MGHREGEITQGNNERFVTMGFFANLFNPKPEEWSLRGIKPDESALEPVKPAPESITPDEPVEFPVPDDGKERKDVTITVREPREFLLYATVLHDTKDYVAAVGVIRHAFPLIQESDQPLLIQERLRLPRYLRDWEKYDEGWADLNDLLDTWKNNRILLPMDHSEIYKSMRIQLVIQGNHSEAVRYGVMSRFSWGTGLCRQERWTELEEYPLNRNIKVQFRKLLKKAGKEESLEGVMEAYCEHLELLPETNIKRLMRDVDDALETK